MLLPVLRTHLHSHKRAFNEQEESMKSACILTVSRVQVCGWLARLLNCPRNNITQCELNCTAGKCFNCPIVPSMDICSWYYQHLAKHGNIFIDLKCVLPTAACNTSSQQVPLHLCTYCSNHVQFKNIAKTRALFCLNDSLIFCWGHSHSFQNVLKQVFMARALKTLQVHSWGVIVVWHWQ